MEATGTQVIAPNTNVPTGTKMSPTLLALIAAGAVIVYKKPKTLPYIAGGVIISLWYLMKYKFQ